jgi:hypothetical protein
MQVSTHDRIIEDLAAVQGRLRTADSAMRLRQHKDEGTPAWEALSAEVLKEASIARAGLSRVLDCMAEDMAHDEDVPAGVNGGRR